MLKKQDANIGQVLLIILLVTTVGLTIGLSLVSRAVNDVKISTQVAESSKAFSAAESGIEAALKGAAIGPGGNGSVAFSGGASANYSVVAMGGDDKPFPLGNIAPGDAKTVWFVNHNDNGTLPTYPEQNYGSSIIDICWGPAADSSDPDSNHAAMEFTLLYHNGSAYYISKVTADPDSGRASSNHFDGTINRGQSNRCQGANKKYHISLNFNGAGSTNFKVPVGNKVVLLRISPIYKPDDIVVSPNSILPAQGKQISSTGKTTSGVARKLNVLQGYSSLSPVFDYTLFVNQ